VHVDHHQLTAFQATGPGQAVGDAGARPGGNVGAPESFGSGLAQSVLRLRGHLAFGLAGLRAGDTAVIDGFLVSPNVTVLEVRTADLGFRFSDHQPVTVRLRLD
jgi:hypothetical protein